MDKIFRSPLFYVGDKYKLMSQIMELLPKQINSFYEPFVGGGTVFLNVNYKRAYLNDFDKNLIAIHKMLIDGSKDQKKFFKSVYQTIKKYNLSRSYKEDVVPAALKKLWNKTYFAKYNKLGYENLRKDFNNLNKLDPFLLYMLLIYGFNRMLRFNKSGEFNLPVGNVDFNKNTVKALEDYFAVTNKKDLKFFSNDYKDFLVDQTFKKDDLVYLDPPYLITFSEYNKFWDDEEEKKLLKLADNLHERGVKFALSNVTHYRGRKNDLLIKWMKKYKVHKIRSNYISYHNNEKKDIIEVLITNYA